MKFHDHSQSRKSTSRKSRGKRFSRIYFMAKAKQQNFEFFEDYKHTKHGGELALGKRKSHRPLATGQVIHLVIKSSELNPLNKGKRCSLLNPTNRMLERIIHEQAVKYGIRIVQEIALNWSHAHIAILVPGRKAYNAFIRTLSARIVKYLSRLTKRNLVGLFDLLPFTRVLNKNETLRNLQDYFEDNAQEAMGLLKREKKKKSRETRNRRKKRRRGGRRKRKGKREKNRNQNPKT
jgi:hypothetical protein